MPNSSSGRLAIDFAPDQPQRTPSHADDGDAEQPHRDADQPEDLQRPRRVAQKKLHRQQIENHADRPARCRTSIARVGARGD